MSTAAVKLTPASRRALLVLMDRHDRGRNGRTSNVTDVDGGLVYWQSGAWLVEAGLAKMIDGGTGWPSSTYLRITAEGIATVYDTWGGADAWRGELARLRSTMRNGG